MGAEHARMLVAEGASVVVGDLLDDDGTALAAELGDRARYVHLDVRDYAQWESAVDAAVAEFGGLDILINNAGLVKSAPIDQHSIEDWDLVIGVNLTGACPCPTSAASRDER